MATTRRALDWRRIALVFLLFAGFGLRLHELMRQDIWWDEARNIDVALRPFLQVAIAPELDIHPPIYFWSLHAWVSPFFLQLGMDAAQIAFVARLLSVAAGTVGIALLYPLTRRVAGRNQGNFEGVIAGLCAVTVATFSPFWLAESQETRMYTLGFALLMGAGMALLKVCLLYTSDAADERG